MYKNMEQTNGIVDAKGSDLCPWRPTRRPLSRREGMGGKGKTALRSALDQATHCKMKFT